MAEPLFTVELTGAEIEAVLRILWDRQKMIVLEQEALDGIWWLEAALNSVEVAGGC